ncbi:DNA replication protein [Brevibacillus parabrevis]|uniref:ATP-binding protein n=1 Tax=Brevibacillus parabrevis TaxID=54914 RepID=UPI001C226751|nr:ATP-binding protein [Brevibacillus parabrevis]MBU8715442.1 DNA replication protein [Brevibacillus parabrevis]
MTNAPSCILREPCRTSSDPTVCTRLCPHFIALHGASGMGGRVAAAAIPTDYRQVTVANSVARADQAKAYAIVERYCETFERQFDESPQAERIKSLYLYSFATGTGKTTTAAAIANTYLIGHYIGSIQRNRRPLNRPVYFLDVNDWQTQFNAFNRPRVPDHIAEPASAAYYRAMEYGREAPFVVMDDIGVRDASDAFRADLHAIINHRVTNRMPTVYTSNVAIEELADVFDKRLADRVRDQCAVVPFVGESKRGMRK